MKTTIRLFAGKAGKLLISLMLAFTITLTFLPVTAYAAVPSAPVLSTEVSVTGNSVTLTWNPVRKAAGYIVYRKDAGKTKWTELKVITGQKVTKYTDRSAISGDAYSVIAFGAYGVKSSYSKRSNTVKIKLLPMTTINVQYDEPDASKVIISWKQVPEATGYQIQRMIKIGSKVNADWATVATVSNRTYYNFTLVKGNNRQYFFRVRPMAATASATCFGKYSKSSTGFIRHQMPEPETDMSTLSADSANLFYITIHNGGKHPMILKGDGILLKDNKDKTYDRTLSILPDPVTALTQTTKADITIPAGSTQMVWFSCKKATRYDQYTRIILGFTYDGAEYTMHCSGAYGATYYLK